MNLLIVGGLLAVGLLALVGAAMLSVGEKTVTAKPGAQAARGVPGTTKLSEPEQKLPALRVEAQPQLLNGQIHELAGEVRSLHQQAIEIGQRLSLLTEIADQLERAQVGSVSIEEDQEHVQD